MNMPSRDIITQLVRDVLSDARASWLFVSAATVHWREGSDIDLAVSMPRPFTASARMAAMEKMIAALGIEVDLLDFNQMHTVMQVQIIDTGHLLFSQDPVALAQYQGFLHTEYQNIQQWRQPMMVQMAKRLAGEDVSR
jgi:predicted nucleotidyltransferase